jgi:FMN phosphatase YigB (HAD superfamily)
MTAPPLYIFDLDGTLADLRHRRHFVDGTDGKKDWDAFHAACADDALIRPVADTMVRLAHAWADVWVWSGRMDTVRAETIEWLAANRLMRLLDNPLDPRLKMRPAGDYTPDHILKERWLHAMSPGDRASLVMVFDDRQRVVDMWRRNGVVCAQVAPGDF